MLRTLTAADKRLAPSVKLFNKKAAGNSLRIADRRSCKGETKMNLQRRKAQTRKKLVATANRYDGRGGFTSHCNRTGEPSVTFCGKEEQRRECALISVKKSEQAIQSLLRRGAGGRTRTGTPSLAVDFEFYP